MPGNPQTQLMDAARARGTTDTAALTVFIRGGRDARYEDAAGLSPFGLSTILVKPTLQQIATPEQKQRWLVPTEKGQINWAYAQTELRHGTFVRGLETTATFDEVRDCFVMNSPTTTSPKYWLGSLAFSATHAFVMARLITKGTDHGVHAVVVQLRHNDGRPVQGIELGDIGVMSSYNQNDNGYAMFHHVVVPRDSLLMARSSVLRDGTYLQPKHSKASYTTMIAGRLALTRAAMFQLAQAVIISIRYSTVRKQGYLAFSNEDVIQEVPLMHYKTHQHLLLSALANAYAMLYATRSLERASQDFEKQQAKGDYSTMGDLHALSAGIQAWAIAAAFDGACDARRACGGHGYLGISNLSNIAAAVDAFRTLEGDNAVMFLQVARRTVPSLAEYRQIQVRSLERALPAPLCAARSHITTLILHESISQTASLPSGSVKPALEDLRSLFALSQIITDATFPLFEARHDVVQVQVSRLLDKLTPEAIALTDAWDISDASLASAIGMSDGNVYERLMSWTRQLPTNVRARENGGQLPEIWEEFVRPVLRAKL